MSWSSEEEEDLADYVVGGYHPIYIGERYSHGRYTILKKLGWGHFSTVWLARDTRNDRKVAVKIVKSSSRYTETALDEIKLLRALDSPVGARSLHAGRSHIISLLDHFNHHGPHGTHVCMVFEAAGETLLDLIRTYKHSRRRKEVGIPFLLVRDISKQVLLGLDYIHRVCGLIHTDIKPENILYTFEPLEYRHEKVIQVKIADLGNATWTSHHFTDFIQTRQYRSPEVIVGAKWDTSADIWSAACVLFELLTLRYLFSPESASYCPREEDHLAQILELCSGGSVPRSLLTGTASSEFMNRYGELRHLPSHSLRPRSLYDILYRKHFFPHTEADLLASFLVPMLEVDPKRRATAAEILQHPFIAPTLSRRELDSVQGRWIPPAVAYDSRSNSTRSHSWRPM